jgi:adenylate cyclase
VISIQRLLQLSLTRRAFAQKFLFFRKNQNKIADVFSSVAMSRRLAAVMFTDMVGYTALGQRDESLSLALVDEQRKLIRPILVRHSGREVKTIGDAFLVEFASALDAVRCAYDIQRSIREFNFAQPQEKRLHVRIGIHLGDIVFQGDGDISGDTVNVASRIEPLADDGGVCFTRQVSESIKGKFDLEIQSLGEKSLKNVTDPIEVFKVVMPWSLKDSGIGIAVKELDSKRIAILPFSNLSPDPNDGYFADGMTEELITTLAKIRDLTVIVRTSIMQYKNTTKRISEISKELGTGTIIEGSVRKSGDRVRITVQLLDSKTEGHLWAENYDNKIVSDVFDVQSKIAEKVAEELRVKLGGKEKDMLEVHPTSNAVVYTLYLKGRHFWNERTKESVEKAIAYFEESVRRDEKFAFGYSGLADCYMVMARNMLAEFGPSYEMAKGYLNNALELDPNLAEAHATKASTLHYYDHDWEASEAEFRRAIEIKPGYSSAHQWYSHLLAQQRRLDEAGVQIRRAFELDPYSPSINHNVGAYYYFQGMYDKSIEQFNKIREMNTADLSPFIGPGPSLIRAYVQKKEYENALSTVKALEALTKRPKQAKLWKGYVLAAMGSMGEAEKLLEEVETNYSSENISPYEMGLVHFMLGDKDEGYSWLEVADSSHDGNVNMLALDVELKDLRGEPRYAAMLEKVGLKHVSLLR